MSEQNVRQQRYPGQIEGWVWYVEETDVEECLADIRCGQDRPSACFVAHLLGVPAQLQDDRINNAIRRDYLRCALAGNTPEVRASLHTVSSALLGNPAVQGLLTPAGVKQVDTLCRQTLVLAENYPKGREGAGFSREAWEFETKGERAQYHAEKPASALGYLGGEISNSGVAQFRHYVAGRSVCSTSFSSRDGLERAGELMDALNKGPARLWNGLKLAHLAEMFAARNLGPAAASLAGAAVHVPKLRESAGDEYWPAAEKVLHPLAVQFLRAPAMAPLRRPDPGRGQDPRNLNF